MKNFIANDSELYGMLERLKSRGVLSYHELNGDEISLLEKLIEMKLASKTSTRCNIHYFYGVDGHEEF